MKWETPMDVFTYRCHERTSIAQVYLDLRTSIYALICNMRLLDVSMIANTAGSSVLLY